MDLERTTMDFMAGTYQLCCGTESNLGPDDPFRLQGVRDLMHGGVLRHDEHRRAGRRLVLDVFGGIIQQENSKECRDKHERWNRDPPEEPLIGKMPQLMIMSSHDA